MANGGVTGPPLFWRVGLKHRQQIARTRTTSELQGLDLSLQMYIVSVCVGRRCALGGNSTKKYLLAGTLLTAWGAIAHAATIPVVNGNFDEFPTGRTAADYLNIGCSGANGPGCALADNVVFGWDSGVTFAKTALSGQWQIGQATNVFNAGASPEPIVLRVVNTTVSQTIAGVTAQAGVTYTLNIDLGFGKGNEDLGNAELWVGGKEVIASPGAGDPV